MAGQTVSMKEPVCLIENDSDGKLCVVRSALDILDQIDQHVVVVSVVGLYRTGKSYLMNKLAGEKKGFALGATIQSKTKGIWMWCVPHPEKRDHTLVLLDTEGLGDVEKGDEKNDNWIFSLAVLLSSTLVYNSMGTIDNNALEKLHYVTELTEHIKVKSNQRDGEESSEYLRYFPSFVWTVRDFTLTLEVDGRPITANEYLENALKLRTGHSQKDQAYNLPRSCLRNYFSPRWCFVFERPASGDKMRRMEELTDADLEPAFVEQAKEFCDHVFNDAKTKTLKQGLKVSGRLLGNLAETYVSAIRSGQIPCLDNAVLALAQIENSGAIERARAHYQKGMADWVAYPTETQEELSEVHAVMEKEAVAIFINNSFKDEDQKYQLELMKVLQEAYDKICERNYKESQKSCESKIQCIFAPLEEKIRDGSYMTPGGYKEYCNDLKLATSEYRSEGGRGVKAEEVLKEYLGRKASIGEAILSADQSLTEAEQRAEAEQAKREASERENRAMEEQLVVQERLRADQQRTYEENVNQLMERMERDSRNAIAEHDRVLQARLKEQNDLVRQGFDDRAHQMQREIDALKGAKAQEEEKKPSFMSTALDTIGTAAASFLPGIIPKVGGMVVKWLSKLF
ncbi:guanylate-binding protein 1-like [Oncorhynchus nerka]|uniref:guanylate-binding protein 1-like n=1 Tax=Oncorhynchus nerka TaxID=8023 RepID=UPI0011315220|nr:guanylate-binding protein 1-like [Oncorhynchus nerka]XP_029515237.1 guanylate-binding protein 1-like [Oncorhynchus nerka]